MAGQAFYPGVSCLATAQAMQTRLVNSVMRLFKSGFTPDFTTTQIDLANNEVSYVGYAPITLPAWANPVLAVDLGYGITSPTVQFAVTGGLFGSVAGGYWIEDSGGNLVVIGIFPEPVPMQEVGRGFPITVLLAFGTG